MMLSPMEQEEQILKELDGLQDELGCFDYLMDCAVAHGCMLDASLRQDCYRVTGCDSRMWVKITADEKGCFHFLADSDSMLLRGMLMLLRRTYDGMPVSRMTAESRFLSHPMLRECFSHRQLDTLGRVCGYMLDMAAAYRKDEHHEESH